MKKIFIKVGLALLSCFALSSCASSAPPTELFNNGAPVELNPINGTSQSIETEDTPIIILDDIPDNYKHLGDNIYAVVLDDNIVGYKLGMKENDEWHFIDCDEQGMTTPVTTTTILKTEPPKPETTLSTTTTKSSTKKTVPATTTTKKTGSSSTTTTKKATTKVTSTTKIPSTTVSTTTTTKKVTTTTTTKKTTTTTTTTKATTTTTTTTSAAFSYKIIQGLSGLPESVSNYFQYYIDEADIATPVLKTKKSDGTTYAMIYVLNGPPVTIKSVAKTGVITYKLPETSTTSKTSCYIIAVTGVTTISFSRSTS